MADGVYARSSNSIVGPLGTSGAALGAWTSYTPTLTASGVNPTIGNGTLSGRYKQLDSKTYAIQIYWKFGTTSAAGTGQYSFALPSGLTSGAVPQAIAGTLVDAGTRYYLCNGWIAASDTKVTQIVQSEAGDAGRVSDVSPMTWASTDEILLTGVIEVA